MKALTSSFRPSEQVARILFIAAAGVSILAVALICVFLLVNGVPAIAQIGLPDFLLGTTWKPANDIYGIFPMIVGSIYVTAGALIVGVPTGILCAVFLARFASQGLVRVLKPGIELLAGIPSVIYGFFGLVVFVPTIRSWGVGSGFSLLAASVLLGIMILPTVTTETLAGIPSIVYGLFGMLFFVTALHWGMSLLAGACTLAIMILPIIMRTAQEALIAVPDDFRMGSFGLGAGRLRTVATVVLPSAVPGILGGVILGMGRVVEEVAALLFTSGSVAAVPDFAALGPGALLSSTRTLAEHMYLLASEGLHINETYATAVVLLVLVVVLNGLSTFAANRLARKATGED